LVSPCPWLSSHQPWFGWYCQFPGWQLASPAPCGGMSEPLAPKEVTCVEIVGRFLTSSESLFLYIFPISLGWLILSSSRGGITFFQRSGLYKW
jgi:hypothetical protein